MYVYIHIYELYILSISFWNVVYTRHVKIISQNMKPVFYIYKVGNILNSVEPYNTVVILFLKGKIYHIKLNVSLWAVIMNYIMTVWLLAGNGINISITAETTYAWRQVISCVTKASVCRYILNANHWHRLWEVPAIIGVVKSNIKTFNYVCRFIVNMFLWQNWI